ncbi:MAG: hypothetical protein JOZ08_11860 [Verrucomicrobia bacterium]|nr:hypothetical protein [Verrucomicrobiota bacterium]
MELKESYDYPLPIQRPSSHGDKFIYIDYVNNEPFYVGMGNWSRVRNPDRNDYHVQMLNNRDRKDRWIRRAVARNLSPQDAFNLESTLILCYGHKDIGTGILVNKNNGVGQDLRNLSYQVSTQALSGLGRPLATAAFLFVLLISSLIATPLLIHRKPVTSTLTATPAPTATSAESSVAAPPLVLSTPQTSPTPLVPSNLTPASAPHYKDAKWPDGGILTHPEHLVNTGVVNVNPNDTLKLRRGPGMRFGIVAEIPPNATDISAFDQDQVWDGDTWWCPVEWNGLRGYVSRSYLPK